MKVKELIDKLSLLDDDIEDGSVKEARETENVTIATMTRKLKKGEDYIYVD